MEPMLLLVDAYAWIYRSFYAVRYLSNSKGQPTNAVFAMTRFLLRLEDEYPTQTGAFLFDCGKPAHRLALAPDYKANRPPMPETMKPQIPVICDMISAFGWNRISHTDYEADDLIACAVRSSSGPVRIVSGDKDLAQLIDDRVSMLVPSADSKSLTVRGVQETVEKFGVPPSCIVDYLAMIGDTSDNIPGLAGVGPKTAASLLQQFGSIDAMLANPGAIAKENLRTKIVQGAEILKKNQALVRLLDVCPCDLSLDVKAFEKKTPDYEAICRIARDMELKSMLRDLESRLTAQKKAVEPEGPVQMELF